MSLTELPSCEGKVKSGAMLPSEGFAELDSNRGTTSTAAITTSTNRIIRSIETLPRGTLPILNQCTPYPCKALTTKDTKFHKEIASGLP